MKKLIIFMIVLLLAGCNKAVKTEPQYQLFETREEALEQFVEDIYGDVFLITTSYNEEILVTFPRKEAYYVSELKKIDDKYTTIRVSSTISFKDVPGASVSFYSVDENQYTISLHQNENDYSILLPDGQHNLSLYQGNVHTNPYSKKINVLLSFEILKSREF